MTKNNLIWASCLFSLFCQPEAWFKIHRKQKNVLIQTYLKAPLHMHHPDHQRFNPLSPSKINKTKHCKHFARNFSRNFHSHISSSFATCVRARIQHIDLLHQLLDDLPTSCPTRCSGARDHQPREEKNLGGCGGCFGCKTDMLNVHFLYQYK